MTKPLSNHPLAIRAREYRARNPSGIAVSERRKNLKFRYGISIEEYDDMVEAQEHRCAICFTHQSELGKRLVVDHCHDSDKVRGLLCPSCNRGLGLLKDSIDTLTSAIDYLEKTTRSKVT